MSDKMSDKEKALYNQLNKLVSADEYITTAMIAEEINIPISTVRRYMTRFCKLGIVRAEGKNRGKRYYLIKG